MPSIFDKHVIKTTGREDWADFLLCLERKEPETLWITGRKPSELLDYICANELKIIMWKPENRGMTAVSFGYYKKDPDKKILCVAEAIKLLEQGE